MKTIVCLLMTALWGLNLPAADTAPKKPSAQVEALAGTLTPPQRTKLLTLLNHGDDTLLLGVPGIGPTRAAAIIAARPFADVADVVRVAGIGAGTFAEMVAHARADFPPPQARKPAARKKSSGKAAAN